MRRILAVLAGLFVLLAALLAAGWVLLHSEWLAGRLAAGAESRLGREVRIGGVRPDLSAPLRPALVLTEVRVGNPDWTAHPWLLETATLRAELPLGRLIRGRLRPSEIALASPALHLERSPEHGASWPTGDGAGGGDLPAGAIRVSDGLLALTLGGPGVATELTGIGGRVTRDRAGKGLSFAVEAGALDWTRTGGRAPDEGGRTGDGAPLPDDLQLDGSLTLARIEATPIAIRDLRATVALDGGRLALDPLTFRAGSGDFDGAVTVEAKGATPRWRARGRLRRFALDSLLPGDPEAQRITGIAAAELDLTSTGTGLAALRRHGAGTVGVVLSEGTLDRALVEKVGTDVLSLLALDEREGDAPVRIRCGLLQLEGESGRFDAGRSVLVTPETNITVDGHVSLAEARWDLVLRPHPKDTEVGSIGSAIHVTGPLLAPAVRVDRGSLATHAGAAVALAAVVSPLAALVPLIEPEDADARPCRDLVDQARAGESAGRQEEDAPATAR